MNIELSISLNIYIITEKIDEININDILIHKQFIVIPFFFFRSFLKS